MPKKLIHTKKVKGHMIKKRKRIIQESIIKKAGMKHQVLL